MLLALVPLLLPRLAYAQLAIQQVPPPEASEFHQAPGGIAVSEPSPIASVPDDAPPSAPRAPTFQGEPPPLPWQVQPQPSMPANSPFAPSTTPASPSTPQGQPAPAATPAPATTTTTAPPPEPPSAEEAPPTNAVVLQGLNKVTGHVSRLEGPIGIVLTFDKLEIIARRCWKAPADQRPENAALLEIRELRTGEEPKKLFLGWMFSSSPGLSGLEHPVYDVNIVSCEYRDNPEQETEPKTEANDDKKDEAKSQKSKEDKSKTKGKNSKSKPPASGEKPKKK